MYSMGNFFRFKIFHSHLSDSFRDIPQKLFSTLNFESYFCPFDGLANKKIRVKYFYMDYKSASYIEIDSTYDIPLHIAPEIETV